MKQDRHLLVNFKMTNKEGKTYRDFVLVWEHEGKKRYCFIRPAFMTDYKFLLASSKDISELDEVL